MRPEQSDSPAADDGARASWRTRFHLAVVAGPDPGWCLPVRSQAQTVGRGHGCDLVLADPEVSRRHLAVRERHGTVQVRDLGSANGSRWRYAGARRLRGARRLHGGRRLRAARRRTARRWRSVPVGAELVVGASLLLVRPRPGLSPAGAHAGAPASPTPAGGPAWPRGRRGRAPGGGPRPDEERGPAGGPRAAVVPLLTSLWSVPLVLASGLSGSRLILLLLLPIVLVGSAAWGPARRALRRRALRRSGSGGPFEVHPSDPAAVLLLAAGVGQATAEGASVRGAGGTSLDPAADGPVALVGRPEAVRGAGRWIACQLAARGWAAQVAGGAQGSWSWARELPPTGPDAHTVLVRDLLDAGSPAAEPDDGATSSRDGQTKPPGIGAEVLLLPSLDRVPPRCRRVVEVADGDPHIVSTRWAAQVAAYLARASRARRTGLPVDVPVQRLLADPDQAWATHDDGLGAVFAVGHDGPSGIDLAREGPHALVAGTTGSGKSELLVCWLLALACRYPPSALTVVAFDYKGGATFAPLADLPHLAGVLTDLDAAASARALAGLRAELARRERILAEAGVRDLAGYRRARGAQGAPGAGPPLGRLLVVVDEFRALTDHHPDLLAALVRLAAQGRSLGIHLLLATQRPGGAIGPELRANIQVAVCLRVTSPAESLDVLGTADAARLPPTPGRALLAAGAVREVQAAWCGAEPEATVCDLVARIRAAAHARGESTAVPLWAPPLPSRAVAPVRRRRIAEPPEVPFVLVDKPDEQRLVTWAWSLTASPLLVVGGPGTGRTTALATLATGALASGQPVHVIGRVPAAIERHPLLGTVVDAADPRRLRRLLDVLADAPVPALVCFDDADALAGPGSGQDVTEALDRLVRARAAGVALAVAGPLALLAARWTAGARYRLVLGPLDAGAAAMAGVPRGLLPGRPPPGRGVLLGDGAAACAQVLLPGTAADPPPGPGPAQGSIAPVRLLPIPLFVDARDLGSSAPDTDRVALGRGGDDAGPLWWAARPGGRLVVTGPPESGRSSALATIAHGLRSLGREVVRIDPATSSPPTSTTDAAWLVDDADVLPPSLADAVAARWAAPGGVLVASARSDTLTTAYRGLAGLLREARSVLVLAPLRGGPAHLPSAAVLPHADPAAPSLPGRGVLVEPRRVLPIQVARTTAAGHTRQQTVT